MKRGRPFKPESEKLTERFMLVVNKRQYNSLLKKAISKNTNVQGLLRNIIDEITQEPA